MFLMSRHCLFLLFFLFIFTSPIQALTIDCISGFNSLAPGISYKKIATTAPRNLVIHVAKVNLSQPGIGLFVTPKDSVGSTTSNFLNNFNLQLAINANPFTSATLNGLSGFAASQGDLYKTTNLPTPSLIATKTNSIQFKDLQNIDDAPDFWNIVSGFNLLTENSQPASPEIIKCSDRQYAQANPGYCAYLAPRTAVGLTSGNQLILMVVDGRQNQSLGASLPELQELMLACRANNSINLDGGSDSTLVAKDQGVLNSPSAGEQTVVTHLGICLNNCDDLSKSAPVKSPAVSAPITNASPLYLTDYLEFSVFPKLAPQSYQDRLKNAMIMRASGQANKANSCSFAPQPNSQEIVNLIKEVQGCGGAAEYVPLKVLQAIYWIEGTVAYANPSAYLCKKNLATALGLMQVTDDPYHSLTPSNEQLSDDQQQCSATGKFSRCYPNDAMEIAARVLLDKIFLWDNNGFKATGSLTSKDDVYYASGRYYGSFQPDALTNQLAKHLSSNLLYPAGHPNFGTLTYSEFVCAMSGFCSSYQDYPLRGDKPYSGTKTNPVYNFSSDCLRSTPSGFNSSGASANPGAAAIAKLYGFTPATIQIHDYQLDTTCGKFRLSQLTPKPLDNPEALTQWLNSSSAKFWPCVPMFTREDTKGFIEAPSGEVHDVKHPHISRTYEVSSALLFLAPFQTAVTPPIDNSLPTVANFLTGSGDVAQEGIFTTINPTESPVKFKTYTPFLKEISDNLIGIYSKNNGIFNLFNTGPAFPKDIHGLDKNSDSASKSKFYYRFLGSDYQAKEYVQSVLQPFIGNY